MDILDLTYDLKKRVEGVKIPLGGDAYLLIAEHGTPAFWEAYRIRKDELCGDKEPTAEQSQDVYASAVAETVLLGWGGIDENGKPAKYSKKKAKSWLMDPAKERFFNLVDAESRKFGNFKAEILESEKKP